MTRPAAAPAAAGRRGARERRRPRRQTEPLRPLAEAAAVATDAAGATTAEAPPRRRLVPAIGALLFLGSLALYLANGRTVSFALGGDSVPNRLIPFAFLHDGALTMDMFAEPFAARGGYRWYVQERNGRLVSFYPIGTPLAAVPFFAPMDLYLRLAGRDSPEELFVFSEVAEKVTAATMTALTVLLTWVALRRRTTFARASWTAAVLATCSLLWPVASQILWQHTVVALLLAGAVAVSPPAPAVPRPLLLGLLLGAGFAVRPQAAVFAAGAAAGLVLAGHRGGFRLVARQLAWFMAGCAVLALPVLAYNRHHYDHWLGGYSHAQGLFGGAHLLEGVSGLLMSPNRGLFVLMPVAVLGVAGAWRLLRVPGADPVLAGLALGGGLFFVLHAATATWAGGWTVGPRYLTEIMPLLAICSTRVLHRPRWPARLATAAAIGWSFLMQLSGAWFYPASNWHGRMGADLESASWDGSHFQPWEDYQAWRAQRRAHGGR